MRTTLDKMPTLSLRFFFAMGLFFVLPEVLAQEKPSYSLRYESYFDFSSADPESRFLEPFLEQKLREPDVRFCAQWNPEFVFSGHRCCRKILRPRRVIREQCAPGRRRYSMCSEMTEEQKRYIQTIEEQIKKDQGADVLNRIANEMGRKGDQAFCTSTNGFLAWGRPIVPSPINHLWITKPERCTQFGTDAFVGMLEWVGRKIDKQANSIELDAKKWKLVRIMTGDCSGPRGGCLPGFSGKRGHSTHTNGLDGDFGFLTLDEAQNLSGRFSYNFDPGPNLWFLRQVFENPFACIKVIFLDRKHIRALDKFARKKPSDWMEWNKIRRFVKHMRGHKQHFHIRVGDGPGQPGCTSYGSVDDEYEIDLSEEPESSTEADDSGSD